MIRLPFLILAIFSTAGIASAQSPAVAPSEVCRATVASVTGSDPAIMRTWAEDDVQFVTYRRPDDGKVWTYRCRLEGSRVIWAAEQGRWRNGPMVGVITFELSQGGKSVQITEIHEDGSKSQATYPRTKLR
jgi:hypothetical protein